VSAARPIAGATAGLIRVASNGLATAAGTARDPMTIEQAVAVAPAGATSNKISQPAKWGPLTVHRLRFPSAVSTNAPFRVPTRTRTPLIHCSLASVPD
jgi:hypothetical protein